MDKMILAAKCQCDHGRLLRKIQRERVLQLGIPNTGSFNLGGDVNIDLDGQGPGRIQETVGRVKNITASLPFGFAPCSN